MIKERIETYAEAVDELVKYHEAFVEIVELLEELEESGTLLFLNESESQNYELRKLRILSKVDIQR